MLVIGTIALYATYLFAALALSRFGRWSGVFVSLNGLRWASICLVFAPIFVAWVYGWALRLAPGHSPLFYLALVTALMAPAGLLELVRLLHDFLVRPRRLPGRNLSQRLSVVFLLVATTIVFAVLMSSTLGIPVFSNDPLEYFAVARQIFEYRRLAGVYPAIDPHLTGGFYGPWTHPAGFVLTIAWGYVVQGTADYAGVAKMHNPFALFSLMLLAFAWAGGLVRYRGVLAAALVFLTPLLLAETLESHVDVARIAMWTATLCLLPAFFTSLSLRNALTLGALAGLSMFIHSIGLIYWGLVAGLVVLLSADRFARRAGFALVALLASLLVVAPDYIQNLRTFGRMIGDSTPLWEIPALGLDLWLNENRGIASFGDKLSNGVFAAFTKTELFGPASIAMVVAAVAWLLAVGCSARLRPTIILPKLTRPTLANVLLLATVGFFGIMLLSVLAGMNLIIKNIRYLMTMTVVAAILAPVLADGASRYWRMVFVRSRGQIRPSLVALWRRLQQWSRIFSRWAVGNGRWALFAACAAAMSVVAISESFRQRDYREWLFPFSASRPDEAAIDRMLVCSKFPGFRLIGQINRSLAELDPSEKLLVMVFRPSDAAYYARFPTISYLQPQLLPAFTAANHVNTYRFIHNFGITHLLVPAYGMGEIENSPFSQLLKDAGLVSVEAEADGTRFYRLTGSSPVLPKHPPLPLLSPGDVAHVDLTSFGSVVTHRTNYGPAECDETLSVLREDGEAVLRISGANIIIGRTRYEIDPAKMYRLSFDVRAFGDTNLIIDAGLATFDRDGKLETSSPGEHRYGVAIAAKVPADGRWVTMSGQFRGVGNDNYNQFRPGTRYVSPVFIVNDRSATISDIRRVRLDVIDD